MMKDRRWDGGWERGKEKRESWEGQRQAITQKEDRDGMLEKRKWKAQDRNGERKGNIGRQRKRKEVKQASGSYVK